MVNQYQEAQEAQENQETPRNPTHTPKSSRWLRTQMEIQTLGGLVTTEVLKVHVEQASCGHHKSGLVRKDPAHLEFRLSFTIKFTPQT